MTRALLISLLLYGSLAKADPHAADGAPRPKPEGVACPTTSDAAKRVISQTALRFFLENTNPETGLVRDTASNSDTPPTPTDAKRASIAATGFGLAVVSNAGKRGILPKWRAERYCETALEFAAAHIPKMTRNGWFLHFVGWRDGSKWDKSEYSTTDTAWFLAGVLACRQAFPTPAIEEAANRIYGAVDFKDMLTDGGTKPNKLTLTLSYRDEATGHHPAGYSPSQWDHYAEQMMLLVLGLGSPNPNFRLPPETWTAWTRESMPRHGKPLIGYDRALFTHQYSHLFLDFRGKKDVLGFDYFDQGLANTLYNKAVCEADTKYRTFKEGFWGLSAGDKPGSGYEVNRPPDRYVGTACIGCVPGSAMFTPTVLDDVAAWCRGPYAARIWGRYGLADSINVDKNWVSPQVHAITVGPEYLAVADMSDENSIWSDFMTAPEIQRGMHAAGFR